MSHKIIKNFNNFKTNEKLGFLGMRKSSGGKLPEGDNIYDFGIGTKLRKELEENGIGSVGRDANKNLIGGCTICKMNGIKVYDHIRSGEHKRNLALSKEKKENYVYRLIKESLINESIIKYTTKFKKLLSEINSPIAKDLLDLENKDITTRSNYFGTTAKNDVISFIPDRKFQDLEKSEKQQKFEVTIGDKYLTYSRVNNKIYAALGFDKAVDSYEIDSDDYHVPDVGEVGTVKGEYQSPSSGRRYCWFVSGHGDCVINKIALRPQEQDGSAEFSKNAQEIKVGRGIKALLVSAGINKTDKEIETFVNLFKSKYDMMNDAFRFFSIVEGEDIVKFYNRDSYQDEERGQLGSSCMAHEECSSYFGIYSKNPDKVKLVVLHSRNGLEEPDTSKIKGRALLWYLEDGRIFMDRIYTNFDADVHLFIEFAKKNKFYCKSVQQQGTYDLLDPKGNHVKMGKLSVILKNHEFREYPYLDTLKYMCGETGEMSNERPEGKKIYTLEDTEGTRDLEECADCDGDGEITCPECDGDGNKECAACDGDGGKECTACDGDGTIECTKCGGAGNINGKECTACDGDGAIECKKCEEGNIECESCGGDGREECARCGGSGNIDCPNCA